MHHQYPDEYNDENNEDKKSLMVISSDQQKQGMVMSLSESGKQIYNNPAIAYLVSLGSKRSRQTMKSFL
ncbi:hypothetical protein KKJ06_22615, partial [Xenorhabdus bovienii]|nr:hypothetical protein [Xenorhabdus bovienii]